MKVRFFLTLLCSVFVFLAGCQSPKTVDYDSAMLDKMRAYESYRIESREQRSSYQHVSLTEIVDRRIVTALENQLKTRGYNHDTNSPDFIVTFFTKTEQKTKVHDLGQPSAFYRRSSYRGFYGFYGGSSRYSIDQYKEGTLIVDIIDNETKQMVWRGAASRRLSHQAPQQDEIQEIIDDILAEFPPE